MPTSTNISSEVIRENANAVLTVIVPVFNRSTLIRETLASIDAQTIANAIVTIVVDDGSTDHTRDIVRMHKDGPGGLLLLASPNRGASAARNVALKHVRTPYVTYLDSDDLIRSDKFEKQLALFSQNRKIDFVTSNWATFTSHHDGHFDHLMESEYTPDAILRGFIRGNFFPVGSAIYRSPACLLATPWPEHLRNFEDWVWHVTFGASGAVGLHCNECLLYIRYHSGPRLSMTSTRLKLVRSHTKYAQRLLMSLRYRNGIWQNVGASICRIIQISGVWHLRAGNTKRGMSLLLRASEFNPSFIHKFISYSLYHVIAIFGATRCLVWYDRFSGIVRKRGITKFADKLEV